MWDSWRTAFALSIEVRGYTVIYSLITTASSPAMPSKTDPCFQNALFYGFLQRCNVSLKVLERLRLGCAVPFGQVAKIDDDIGI